MYIYVHVVKFLNDMLFKLAKRFICWLFGSQFLYLQKTIMDSVIDNNVLNFLIIALSCSCMPRGEVVVRAGDEEAITCTDIGELLSSCHQSCVTRWDPITRFRSCWWCSSMSTSTTAEENWLVHTDRNNLTISIILLQLNTTVHQYYHAD